MCCRFIIHCGSMRKSACSDHLSGGRLQIGVGRGGALVEHQRYGADPAVAQATYHEAFAVLMRAFTDEVANFEGRF
jgi:alkanesulfonate monooxygenase SsuD/methylene tetrahydromethanopterin reductase-like flavin-dependent oxidoreductase (luciferase family)